MTTKSKRKGATFELELVRELQERGIEAEKAWGSNGKALGESEGVDLVFNWENERWRVQAKRRAKIPEYVKPPEGADIVMMREDRGETLVVIPLRDFLDLL